MITRTDTNGHVQTQIHIHIYIGKVLLRAMNPRTCVFNELWWSEFADGAPRDQLSFGFSLNTGELCLGIAGQKCATCHPYRQSGPRSKACDVPRARRRVGTSVDGRPRATAPTSWHAARTAFRLPAAYPHAPTFRCQGQG